MSLGDIVLGLLSGLTIGLLAVGLVLVYKSNRFLNLAHAQMGTLSALLMAKAVLDWHWNWWVALVMAIAIGFLVAVLVERGLVAPLRRKSSSSIRLLLLTIGVSQLLLALAFVPHVGPSNEGGVSFPQPFEANWRVGGVVLSGMWVFAAIVTPII